MKILLYQLSLLVISIVFICSSIFLFHTPQSYADYNSTLHCTMFNQGFCSNDLGPNTPNPVCPAGYHIYYDYANVNTGRYHCTDIGSQTYCGATQCGFGGFYG